MPELALNLLERPGQLRDGAAELIREAIVIGRARSGEILRLAPLAEQIGISITPVREALLQLAQEGWVIQEPNKGFRVAPIRRNDVEDTYFVHEALVAELAVRAASRIKPPDIERMRSIDESINALGNHDLDAERLNYALHQVIYTAADAPRIEWFVAAASRFVPRQFWGTVPGWFEHNRTGHKPIIDCLERGDAEAAGAAMSAHIAGARKLLLSYLDSISIWS